MTRGRMSENLSVYLDLLRLAAAFAVFLNHTHNILYPDIRVPFIFGLGREAVAIFFVLSGLVISYVVADRETGWRSYAIARASRILPVAILAIAVTCLCDLIGQGRSPEVYRAMAAARHFAPDTLGAAVSYLTFTNQLWFRHVILGSDEPFWSLGFEVWYYVGFALVSFLRARTRIVAVVIWALVCGPRILLYFPLWLLGVAAWRLSPRIADRWPRPLILPAFGLSILAFPVIVKFLSPGIGGMYEVASPAREAWTAFYFTLLGALAFVNLALFDAMAGERAVWSGALAKAIRWLAGASFTLYLVHQPLCVLCAALFKDAVDNATYAPLACAAIFLMVLALAEIGERRRKFFARLIGPVFAPRARAMEAAR